MRNPSAERLLLSVACVGVLALGSLPWALVPGGPFTHLRDRFLLSSAPGLAFESFYYRWTLYPAEVLKPLRAKTQPTVTLSPEASPGEAEKLCHEALQIRALCLPPGEAGADARLEGRDGEWEIALDDAREAWPRSKKSREEAWEELSRRADPSAPLRAFTGWALAGGTLTTRWPPIPRYLSILLGGCPLALLWGFTAASLAAGGWLPRRWLRVLASTLCAAIIAAALAWAGLPDPAVESAKELVAGDSAPDREALTGLLFSTRPALRFQAVRAAHRLGPDARPLLLDALSDPVINVRYAAAEALGRIGGPDAQPVLLAVLTSGEEWYVKERAYAGLWRLGWRPR